MGKLLFPVAAACMLLACSDGKSTQRADGGTPQPDADLQPDGEGDPEEDAAAGSSLARPPGTLERPPTRLPDDLKPPR